MTEIFVSDADELNKLSAKIDLWMSDYDIKSYVNMSSKANSYLIFDRHYVTDADSIAELVNRSTEKYIYIVYLIPNSLQEGFWSEADKGSALRIDSPTSEEEVRPALDVEPIHEDAASFGTWVESGAVLSDSDSWAIWFSGRLDLAIAAFEKESDAIQFQSDHSDIQFLSRDDLATWFDPGKGRSIPAFMEPILARAAPVTTPVV